ncbi:MAG: DivIVA domain-containing protein [Turicibacter sp.]|nr:DivIVA domain-containing protein [Turicibacter sp.]
METFNIVKRGYSPQEVDEYIQTLERVIKSYKDKDNAIKNAIISAQVAADNIIKTAKQEVKEYKTQVFNQMKIIYDTIEQQRVQIDTFQSDYNKLVQKHLKPIENSEMSAVYGHIESLERKLQELSRSIKENEL